MAVEGLRYLEMGPWPFFVGVTADPKAFSEECDRLLKQPDTPFMASKHAHATCHSFTHPKHGLTVIIAMSAAMRGRTKPQVAALVAHEAYHAVEALRDTANQGRTLGSEAEAYLVQYITQGCLEQLWLT